MSSATADQARQRDGIFSPGKQAAIDPFCNAVGFRYKYDPKRDEFAHPSGIVVLTPSGKVSRYFYDVKFSPRDLRLGLVEASDNKIGSPVDQVLLFCFHYDPAEGKYGAAVMRIVRAGGVLTLLLVVTALVWLFRRGPRPQVGRRSRSGETGAVAERSLSSASDADPRRRDPDDQRDRPVP